MANLQTEDAPDGVNLNDISDQKQSVKETVLSIMEDGKIKAGERKMVFTYHGEDFFAALTDGGSQSQFDTN